MTRGLSIDRPGTDAGRDPVATMACSNDSVSSPPAVDAIVSVCESTNDARPWTYWTLRCFDNCPSPPVSFWTTPSLKARSLSRSIFGSG